MKKKYNRRKWLNGYPDCNAYVIVALTYDTQEDEIEGSIQINLGEKGTTKVYVYGGVFDKQVTSYGGQLDDLIEALQGVKAWIRNRREEVLEKSTLKNEAANK